MLSHEVPMDPGKPSRTQLYSFGSDTPCGCSHHLSQWSHGILDTPVSRKNMFGEVEKKHTVQYKLVNNLETLHPYSQTVYKIKSTGSSIP